MSRGPHDFKESAVVRAFHAARKAGVPNPTVEIELLPTGRRIIRIGPAMPAEPVNTAAIDNEWDEV